MGLAARRRPSSKRLALVTTVAVALLTFAGAARADTIPVTSLADDGGPGTLRTVIGDAAPGSTIVVPAGTITLGSPLSIAKDLTIDGAGPASTIVSGGFQGRVLTVTGTPTLTLSGLTVRDGLMRAPQAVEEGGGLSIDMGATVHVDHAVFTNNVVDAPADATHLSGIADGGAIHNMGTLTLDSVSIVGNSALARGTVPGKYGGNATGGGVSSSGPLTITRSNISGNVAISDGGPGPSSGNNTHGGISEGGGVFVLGAVAFQISDTTISGNVGSATGGPGSTDGIAYGGGLMAQLSSGASLQLAQVTVAGNTIRALGDTGGIVEGGGIKIESSSSTSASIDNSTLAGNAATTAANIGTGGDILHDSTSADLTIRNTIVSGGQGQSGSENCSGPIQSLGHNIDSRDQCSFTSSGDQRGTDPRLGALQDNGGPGPTMGFGLDSPAFDKGDPNNCPPADERGVARPQGAGCDIGAFELELADLGLRGSANKSRLKLGSTVTFTLIASNGGSGTGHGTTISEALPSGLALVSATPVLGTCSGKTTVVCDIGNIIAGSSGGAQIVARAVKPGTQAASATISSGTVDPSSGNNAVPLGVSVGKLAFGAASLSPRTFHLGSKLPRLSKVRTGTTIRFRLPEAAKVRLTFLRKKGKRFRRAGALTVRGHAGLNKLRFQGRLSRHKKLKPGRYRLTLRATDKFGNRSAVKRLRFTLLPPP